MATLKQEVNTLQQEEDIILKSAKNSINIIEQTYLTKSQMYNTVHLVNMILLFLYSMIFLVLHVKIGIEYLQGYPRNEVYDSLLLTIFFVYPFAIYSIEAYIYKFIAFFIKLIFGQTTIPSLDLLMGNLTELKSVPTPDTSQFV